MSHQYDPATNTYRDTAGTPYQSNGPWTHGSPATSYNNGQRIDGSMVGGFFVPNKK